MYDRILRGGTVIDGTGSRRFGADVAIKDGMIVDVGRLGGSAKEVIDVSGLIVAPGFIDTHTHYDGQICWDRNADPSPRHGVTTVIFGNCGVSFAPTRKADRPWAIGLMESVEDIPAAVLEQGLSWEWESFPEYMDFLRSRKLGVNVGTHITHGLVRAFVMGERGMRNEAASDDDLRAMASVVEEGMAAGALGFSTSRTTAHRGKDGQPVPGTFADEAELFAMGHALARSGRGVFQVAPAGAAGATFETLEASDREIDWMERLAEETGRPVTFALIDIPDWPGRWRRYLDRTHAAWKRGVPLRPMTGARPPGAVFGLQTGHAFSGLDSFQPLAVLPLAEKVARMRNPATRAAILAEVAAKPEVKGFLNFAAMYPLGDPPTHFPAGRPSLQAEADAQGRDVWDVYYDHLLNLDGREWIAILGSDDASREILASQSGVLSLGDGGAHVTFICDMSTPTVMLMNGLGQCHGGSPYPLEWAVWKLTGDAAALYGLRNRGMLLPGKRADITIFDADGIALHAPRLVHDLPGGGARLTQEAEGYHGTMVGGEFLIRDGHYTGEHRGSVVTGTE